MAALIGHLWVWQSLLRADLIRKALVSIMLNLIDTYKWIAKLLDKYEVVKNLRKKLQSCDCMYITLFHLATLIAIYEHGKYYWEIFFVMINEIT